MIARITSKGQITIPRVIRNKLSVTYGDRIDFKEKNGEIVIESCNKSFDIKDLKNSLQGVKYATDKEIEAAKSIVLRKKLAQT